MENVTDVRKKASETIEKLENGNTDHRNAQVVVNALNVMIASAKAQIEHYKSLGVKTKIAFLAVAE